MTSGRDSCGAVLSGYDPGVGHPAMKTIASFSQPVEAHMLRSRLEVEGITAYLRDENMIALDWLYSNALGGVKVDVADEDYERALEIMASLGTSP